MTRERYERSPGIGQVPLSDGSIAYVDPEDFDRVMQHARFPVEGHNTRYAQTRIAGQIVWLHRFVLDVPEGVMVDHWDGDGLNCKRGNIRRADATGNSANQHIRTDNKSGYRGVSVRPNGRDWVAKIGHMGGQLHLGTFRDPVEAAKAYDAAARILHGEFAVVNFPSDRERQATRRDVFSKVELGGAAVDTNPAA